MKSPLTRSPVTLALAAALAVSAAGAPTLAQPSYSDSEYQQRLRDWQAERDRYEAQRQAYEADRRAWENRYGRPGPYAPGYVPGPYDPAYRPPGPDPRYDRRYDDRYPATDPYRYYRDSPCERRAVSNDRRVAGTVLGALVGGAIGANVASEKVETEGAVLGAVVGGAVGNAIASGDTRDMERYGARCDDRGYYYTYEETFPYREDVAYRGRPSGRYDYDYYTRERCRLAIAPAEWEGRVDYRYVRVCPDRDGRFRITS